MSEAFGSVFSRRSFLRSAGAAGMAAASLPALAAVSGTGMVKQGRSVDGGVSRLSTPRDDDLISLSMNETPLGPAQPVLDAIAATSGTGNRYHYEVVQKTVS